MNRYLAVSWMGEPRRFLVVGTGDRYHQVVAEAASFDMAAAIASALSPPETAETDSGVSSAEPMAPRATTGQPEADAGSLARLADSYPTKWVAPRGTPTDHDGHLRCMVVSSGVDGRYCVREEAPRERDVAELAEELRDIAVEMRDQPTSTTALRLAEPGERGREAPELLRRFDALVAEASGHCVCCGAALDAKGACACCDTPVPCQHILEPF